MVADGMGTSRPILSSRLTGSLGTMGARHKKTIWLRLSWQRACPLWVISGRSGRKAPSKAANSSDGRNTEKDEFSSRHKTCRS